MASLGYSSDAPRLNPKTFDKTLSSLSDNVAVTEIKDDTSDKDEVAETTTTVAPVPNVSSVLHTKLARKPATVVRSQGSFLYTSDGAEIFDATCGAAVTCIGHNDKRVRKAIVEQLDKVAYIYSPFFTTEAAEQLATELTASTGGKMSKVFIVSSGTEAVEAALKMARQYFTELAQPQTQRTKFIARKQSYHGNTLGSLSVGFHPGRRAVYESILAQNVSHVSPCYPYRGMKTGESEQAYVARLAQELEDTFQELGPDTVCAFVAETTAGMTLGCVPPVPGYHKAMKEVCERHGALYVLDEVMSGMGRTGTLHAWEQEGVVPDLQTVAKGLGAGYAPIGALLVGEKVVDVVTHGTGSFVHSQTYQGHPIACAASNEVQRIIREENLLQNVRERGEQLEKLLQQRLGDHKNVGDIRGRGLFWGVELVKDKATKEPLAPSEQTTGKMHQIGMQTEYGISLLPGSGTIDGKQGDVIVLAPAYNITSDDVSLIVERLEKVIKAVLGKPKETRPNAIDAPEAESGTSRPSYLIFAAMLLILCHDLHRRKVVELAILFTLGSISENEVGAIGCFECSRRRIDCDRGTPECQKCLQRGLACSGLGTRYRFNDGLASRGRLVGQKLPTTSRPNQGRTALVSDANLSIDEGHNDVEEISHDDAALVLTQPMPDHLDAATRSLYTYFAINIAPIMAVIDRGFNGYRDLILPLAEYDPLVQKAVVVAATEHLASKLARYVLPNPNTYNSVLCGLRLRSQTMVPYKDDISMTTLLLLLVCEMISGGDKFTQIYGIMRGLIRSAGANLQFSSSRLGQFVEIQTLRVQLIAESLFNEAEGSNFVHVQLEKSLEFLRYCQSLHPEHSVLMSLLFDIMTQACRLYVLRASTDPPLCDTVQLVEDFKQLAEKVADYEHVVGHHLLLWPYFVAGAESSTIPHRRYFSQKMQAMYRTTRCENTLKAMHQLDRIWEAQSTTRWTSLLGGPGQVFIM
ncbi:putative aminotransferase [Exophiala viscosa]|uniref:putative aminotransferase n=1 Tax=Exophiala viscosa TaxID=2486360 RepID=UPI0021999496|nr:putative aminotransferase [Exophiala viscosa]